jgi:DnaJ family protein A protein 5
LAIDERPYFLYMPHCPRPLYEAVLASNWPALQKSSSRWLLLGNELLDYIPHAVTTRALGLTEQSDMVVVVRSRRARKGRSRPTNEDKVATDGVLERLGEMT